MPEFTYALLIRMPDKGTATRTVQEGIVGDWAAKHGYTLDPAAIEVLGWDLTPAGP